MNDVPDFLAPDTLYPGKGQGIEGVANFPDGPPADFATRPAGRQETEDATGPPLQHAFVTLY